MAELSFLENFIVDASFALMSKTVEAPLHTVKQRMLLKRNQRGRYVSTLDCAIQTWQKKEYGSTIDMLTGSAGLWRGNLYKCVRYFPPKIVNLTLKDRIDTLTRYISGSWQPFLGGYLVGCISLFLVYPFDYAINLMIIDEIHGEVFTYTGVANIIRREAEEGVHRLYRGFTASVLGIAVYRATFFAVFAVSEQFFPSELSSMQIYIYRVFLQLVAGFVSYPLDTVRRKQLMERSSFYEAVNSILEQEEPAEFFSDYDLEWNIIIGFVGVFLTSSVAKLKSCYVAARCTCIS